jgi:hypothetical protein
MNLSRRRFGALQSPATNYFLDSLQTSSATPVILPKSSN